MRAINLVPADARPGRVNGGKSGGAVYGVLGVLLVMILAASVFATSKRKEAQANQELATVQQSTQAYTTLAGRYASFESAAKQANVRIETVRELADARFDWAGSLRDLSRLVPATTQITDLSASVDQSTEVGDGGASTVRAALPSPAIAMKGCTQTQATAANLVAQLQAMRRVTNVTLESSVKTELDEGDDTDPFANNDCKRYQFSLVVFFAPGSARSSANVAPSGGTTQVSTETAGGTTPASTGGN